MKRRKLLLVPLLLLGMAVYIFLIYISQEDSLRREKFGNVTFLSGGLSDPERRNLEDIGWKYSLKVILGGKNGENLSGVKEDLAWEGGNNEWDGYRS